MRICKVDGCSRDLSRGKDGLCGMHYMRWKRYGRLHTILSPNTEIDVTAHGYIRVKTPQGRRYEHIVLAEKALGKPLPKGAQVHHMNEKRWDNHTLFNLVICPNYAYHKLLHRRMKELGYEGN